MNALLRGAALALVLSACSGAAPAPKPAAPPEPAPKAAPVPAPDPEAWRDTKPGPGPLAESHYPRAETQRLDNGLSIYVVRRPVGVVSLSLVARGGGSRVPAGQSGLAALTVRMMTEGTTRLGSLALAEAAESLGSSLEESAGRDSVRLGITVLRDDLKRGLSLLSDVARNPSFSPKELERVRAEWLDSLEAERQSPSRLASLVGLRLLLGTTIGAPVSGSHHDVRALKREDLVRFHRENFVPSNVALVVVGDVSPAEVKPLAEELFGAWRGAAPKAPHAELPPPPSTDKVRLVDRPGAVQSALFVAQRFPKRSEPGFEARELLNDLVGGLFTSRLNTNLREEHAYTYGVRSLDIATRDWGAFAVMTSVRTDVTSDALAQTLSELTKARDPSLGRPFTEAEVETGRVDLSQALGATLSHTSDIAGKIEDLFVHELDDAYYEKYPAVLDGTPASAVTAEGRRLAPDAALIVIVGDRAQIQPKLEARSLAVEVVPEALLD